VEPWQEQSKLHTDRALTAAGTSMTRVLVIDDDRSVSIAIEALLLQKKHFAIKLANTGEIARTLHKSSFDLIFVDIVMPGLDGFETIKLCRGRAPAIPIVAMSGFKFSDSTTSTPDFLRMAATLGAAYCLRKPFTIEQLMMAVYFCVPQPGAE
jgi:CheY-like chemotaxis protein